MRDRPAEFTCARRSSLEPSRAGFPSWESCCHRCRRRKTGAIGVGAPGERDCPCRRLRCAEAAAPERRDITFIHVMHQGGGRFRQLALERLRPRWKPASGPATDRPTPVRTRPEHARTGRHERVRPDPRHDLLGNTEGDHRQPIVMRRRGRFHLLAGGLCPVQKYCSTRGARRGP